MLDNYNKFLDDRMLIVQNLDYGGDGGDSYHRFGATIFSLICSGEDYSNVRAYYEHCMQQYQVPGCKLGNPTKLGYYRRHPDPTKWYSKEDNFSRDQEVMGLAAMFAVGDQKRVMEVRNKLIKRFGFHQNTKRNYDEPGTKVPDIVTPAEIATIIRMSDSKWTKYLLPFLDSFLFIDAILAELDDKKSKAKGKRTDYHTMLAIDMLKPVFRHDTWVARMARRFYKRYDYKGAIKWIFSPENNDPPVDTLLIPLCEKYIDKA